MNELQYKSYICKKLNDSEAYELIASDETRDRHGEVIKADGWILDDFKENAPMLWNHDAWGTPAGSFKNIRVEDKKLKMVASFASTEKGKEIKTLFDEGHLKTFSVGFMVKERDEKDPSIITKALLLEVSAVPIPANPKAKLTSSKQLFSEMITDSLKDKILKFGIEEIEKRFDYFEEVKPVLKSYRENMTKVREKFGVSIFENELEQIEKVFAKVLENPKQAVKSVKNSQSSEVAKAISKVLSEYLK
jgi:HK97 family phage prohead protease